MEIKVLEIFNNYTIDEYLAYFHVNKSLIYKLKLNKAILVNNNYLLEKEKLKTGDIINIDLSIVEEKEVIPSYKNINIAYEDDDIIIVNKPCGILVHTDGIDFDTLSNRLAYYCKSKGLQTIPKALHRLDYDTSGIVIFCKNILAHSYLNDLLEKHQIRKVYVCVVKGIMENKEDSIKTNIAKDRHSNKQMASKNSKFGKTAVTTYKVIKEVKGNSYLEVIIQGGRKHQIRVHLASIHHPIIGDSLYGDYNNTRLMLHFKTVEFIHPRTNKLFKFTISEDF